MPVINIFKEVIFSNSEKICVLISEQRLLEKTTFGLLANIVI